MPSLLANKFYRSGSGVNLPVFAEPVGGALQHLLYTGKTEVGSDGYTYLLDKANTGTPRDIQRGYCGLFDGVDGKVTIGNVGNTQYLQVWVRQVTDNQVLFTLNGAATGAVSVVAGVLTFGSSLTVNNIYVDGVSKTAAEAGALLNDNNVHLLYIEYNQFAASNLLLGTDGTNYGNIQLFELRVGDTTEPLADVLISYQDPNYLHGTEAGIWHIDEQAGTTVFDSSGNGNHGTASGGFSYTTQDVVSFQNKVGFTEGIKAQGNEIYFSGHDTFLQNVGDYFDFNCYNSAGVWGIPINTGNYGFYLRSTGVHAFYKGSTSNRIDFSGQPSASLLYRIYCERISTTQAIFKFYYINGTIKTHTVNWSETAYLDGGRDVFGGRVNTTITKIVNNGVEYSAKTGWSGMTLVGTNSVANGLPAKLTSSTPTTDVLGNALAYTCSAPKKGRLIKSHCATFDGVSEYVNFFDVGVTTYIECVLKLNTVNQVLLSLDGNSTTSVSVSAGVLTFGSSLTVNNIYVDGVSKTAAEAGALLNDLFWHKLKIEFSQYNSTKLLLGTDGANYGNISVVSLITDTINTPVSEGAGDRVYDINEASYIGYSSDFSSGVDGWSSLLSGTTILTGGVSVGGYSDVLEIKPADTTTSKSGGRNYGVLTAYQIIDFEFEYYLPSLNTVWDGFQINTLNKYVVASSGATDESPVYDKWTKVSVLLWIPDNVVFDIVMMGGSSLFPTKDINDRFYIKNVKLTFYNHGLITGTEANIWANTQDLFHYNILNGFSLYEHATSNPIRVPYSSSKTPLSITPPSGYSKTSDNPAGAYHNNAETLWKPNPFDAPELINKATLTSAIERHPTNTFARPEFINKNNINKTKNYVVYSKHITTQQGDDIDKAIGN